MRRWRNWLRPCIPIGRGIGLKIHSVSVRVRPGTPNYLIKLRNIDMYKKIYTVEFTVGLDETRKTITFERVKKRR